MRINIYSTSAQKQDSYGSKEFAMIASQLPRYGHTVARDYPDVVHIWGKWDGRSASEIRRWHKLFTPVVFSSTEGLAELCDRNGAAARLKLRNDIKTVCRLADIVTVQGGEEKRLVEKSGHNEAVTVLNPFVTSLISEKDCADRYEEIYTRLYSSHDEEMRKACESKARKATSDNGMAQIISQTLYVEYLFKHGTCYESNLKTLAETFIRVETDEDALSVVLQRLGLKMFTQRFMGVMGQRNMLTEGFMPVEQLYDRHARQLDKGIKVPQKQ